MIVVNASEVKNAFGKYLDLARIYGEVQIVRYNKVVAKIVGLVESENKQETKEYIENK